MNRKRKRNRRIARGVERLETRDMLNAESLLPWLDNQQVPNDAVPVPAGGRSGLVASYEIPSDANCPNQPNCYFLTGRSWSYDVALFIIANTMEGRREPARKAARALSGLMEEGKIGFWYNTIDAEVPEFKDKYRTGTIAWVGYAFLFYQRVFADREFENDAKQIGDWIVNSMQDQSTGSVRGGPDDLWYSRISTEHNIDAYFFLRDLGIVTDLPEFKTAAQEIADSLLSNHWHEPYHCFQEGIDPNNPNFEPAKALDAGSWGAIFLASIGETAKANSCLDFVEDNFPITVTATVAGSSQTVNGYRPYPGTGVVWSEGSLGVALAYLRLGNRAKYDEIVSEIYRMQGPNGGIIYAVPDNPQFRDWESVAGTAWMIMVQSENQGDFWSDVREEPPWQNPAPDMRWDVDDNGSIGITDLLALVDALREHGLDYHLPTPSPELEPPPYLDVDGDGILGLRDLLAMIGKLRDDLTSPGEAESLDLEDSLDTVALDVTREWRR